MAAPADFVGSRTSCSAFTTTSGEALASLAPPKPKPKAGRPKTVPQRPAGTPDIRQFFSAPKKRDRDDDDGFFRDDIENLKQ